MRDMYEYLPDEVKKNLAFPKYSFIICEKQRLIAIKMEKLES